MINYCTEACYYNDCGICTKGFCPRFIEEIEILEEEELEENGVDE